MFIAEFVFNSSIAYFKVKVKDLGCRVSILYFKLSEIYEMQIITESRIVKWQNIS